MFAEWAWKRIESIGPAKIVVGLSGGVDSVALLHMTVEGYGPRRVSAVHVHHGIAAEADDWQACCERHCRSLGVELVVRRVDVEVTGNLEANARRARYEAFESVLAPGDVLLLAHHSDDQVETILHNLFRGSARFGVTGMPAERRLGDAVLIRPLIESTREAIRQWAAARELEWIEDPANADESFTRNFLRHRLLPDVEQRWPNAGRALLEASRRDEEFRQVIDFAAEIDAHSVCDGAGIRCEGLSRLPWPRQVNLLRYRLERLGLPQPGRDALARGLGDLLGARDDGEPLLTWQGVGLRRFQGRLFIVREPATNESIKGSVEIPAAGTVRFGSDELVVTPTTGYGVRQRENYVATTRGPEMEIRLRHRRPLKKLMQEMGVPPWLRDRIPIVCDGDVVVAIPGLPDWQVTPVIADGYAPAEGEAGVEMTFRTVGQPYSD